MTTPWYQQHFYTAGKATRIAAIFAITLGALAAGAVAGAGPLPTPDCKTDENENGFFIAGKCYSETITELDLRGSRITDLSPLAGFTNLKQLDLYNTQVRDLSPLVGLTNLEELSVAGWQISDLSPLAGLTKLESLDASHTQVSDLSPLAGLTKLKGLTAPDGQEYKNKTTAAEAIANWSR